MQVSSSDAGPVPANRCHVNVHQGPHPNLNVREDAHSTTARASGRERATTVFVCESALALAVGTGTLPGGRARDGVLTPATGLGDVLVERLRKAGTIIEIPST